MTRVLCVFFLVMLLYLDKTNYRHIKRTAPNLFRYGAALVKTL